MREQLLSIGDDYWIEDASGNRAFKVDGNAVRVRDTFVLRDTAGNEAAKIQERAVRRARQLRGRGPARAGRRALLAITVCIDSMSHG